MATVNPNTLSDEQYWNMANRLAVQNAPVANPAPPMMVPPEARYAGQVPGAALADIASRGGIAVQQNGYDATAQMPIAAGPAWAGPSPVPAYPRSGAHYSPAGMREGWENWGIPPVLMQSSPYATAAYRTFTDPYGQLGVQPLIGFPSAYPHVLSGVPNSPFRVQGFMNALLPQAGFMPFMGMPQMPVASAPQAKAGTAQRASQPPAVPSVPVAQPPAQQIPFVGPPPPEVRYSDGRQPVTPVPQQPEQTGVFTTNPDHMFYIPPEAKKQENESWWDYIKRRMFPPSPAPATVPEVRGPVSQDVIPLPVPTVPYEGGAGMNGPYDPSMPPELTGAIPWTERQPTYNWTPILPRLYPPSALLPPELASDATPQWTPRS